MITLDGRRLGSVCAQRFDGRKRAVSVTLTNGQKLTELADNLENTTPVAETAFYLAGCPRPLLKWIVTQLNLGLQTQVAPVRLDGVRLYRLRFRGAILDLELFTVRPGDLPVALGVTIDGVHGTSRVVFGAVSPADAAPPAALGVTGRSDVGAQPPG